MPNAWIEPLSEVAPQPIPHPVMRQSWVDLTFLHWRYAPAVVRPLVPPELELDLCDGAAWVGLVPFRIVELTLPRAPAVPWLSHFAETNLRTYVFDGSGRRGVWFFSLDAARLAAVAGARLGFALPYFWARMQVKRQCDAIEYRSRRIAGRHARTEITVNAAVAPASPTELEVFLTARFRLYARRRGRLFHTSVEHPPWPLRRAELVSCAQELTAAARLPSPAGDPLVHFAERVDVLVAAPHASAASRRTW
jgi:uncharacterized protein YqjF (DUF2071 family)